ncbi:MAG: PilZ domain-containing protein [Acidobacteriales bacterium]|nr:PilZ domain-containing protein [Terriglobales bacterium]
MPRKHKRASLAIPVRVSRRLQEGSTTSQMACTLDITPDGARLNGIYSVEAVGEIISVERGKNKAYFRVVWIGQRGTAQAGQLGVQCIEPDKNIWDIKFISEADEPYGIFTPEMVQLQGLVGKDHEHRVRCSGHVELTNGHRAADPLNAPVTNISADGCYVRTTKPFAPNSPVNLKLRLNHAEVHLRGRVRSADRGQGMWVEFNSIRHGDLELLQRVLNQLTAQA